MLTDVRLRQAKPDPGRVLKLADGHGLYLEIRPSGARIWRYRYRLDGRENLYTIGPYPQVSLAAARAALAQARDWVRAGQHPTAARAAAQAAARAETFGAVTQEWLDKHRPRWSATYRRQVERTLAADALPVLAARPMRSITAADLLAILQAVERRGAQAVAVNLRQWFSSIWRYAVATLRADHDPAAALRGAIVRLPVRHAEALREAALRHLLARLRHYGGLRSTALALELLLLTAVRGIELRRAAWTEIDWRGALWRIPAAHMKMRRPHWVPLSTQALARLRELQAITGAGPRLLPNTRQPAALMSATTLNRALAYLGLPHSAHDFRATVSTHLHEQGWRSDWIERQLAHVETSRTRAAYNHAEYLDERRRMLQAWADWLDTLRPHD